MKMISEYARGSAGFGSCCLQSLKTPQPRIERYEDAVYWLQPKGGTVDQQEACICVNGIKTRYQTFIYRTLKGHRVLSR